MAEIYRTRGHNPCGDPEYCVEWQDNDGIGRERYFKSRRAAERYSGKIESDLLTEAVQYLQADHAAAKAVGGVS